MQAATPSFDRSIPQINPGLARNVKNLDVFSRRRRDFALEGLVNHLTVMSARELEGREASPSPGVIDSQSVMTTESGGVCGYDAGKKVKGRKRHFMTDTLGLLLFAVIHSAGIPDRDGAPDVFRAIRHRFPWLRHVFADGGYAGDKLQAALKGPRRLDARDHQALRRREGVRGSAASIGRRANIRMARAMPQVGKGLGAIAGKLNGLDPDRKRQAHDTASRKILRFRMNF